MIAAMSSGRWRIGVATVFLACLACLAFAAGAGGAVDYEFRVVPYDQPDTTVDHRVRRETAGWAMFPYTLTEAQRGQYIPPYACWARNILLDGKSLFEIYERGKFIGRYPLARQKLSRGKHTIWPGDHAFTVGADGKITTDDPELLVSTRTEDDRQRGKVTVHLVRIKCYPVRIRATNADAKAQQGKGLLDHIPLPQLALRAGGPTSAPPREAPGAGGRPRRGRSRRGGGGDARELLPQIRRFLWVTAWLPANTVGKGYVIYPLRHTFHLTSKGIVAGAGGGERMPIWRTENKFEVVIPTTRVPVTGDPGTDLLITGHQVLRFSRLNRFERKDTLRQGSADLYSRKQPYDLRITPTGPGMLVDGDLGKLPCKMIHVGLYGAGRNKARVLLVETRTRHMQVGRAFRARVRLLDAGGARGGAGVADGVFAQLQAHGSYKWRELSCKGGADRTIEVSLPDLNSGVYKLRLGMRTAGATQDEFYADQWVTVAAEGGSGIGAFTQRGRTAFYRGERFWLGVGVLAAKGTVPAGTDVTVDLVYLPGGKDGPHGTRIALYRGKVPAAITDRHTFVLDVEPVTSQALAPGQYLVDARVGGRSGPPLHVEMVDPAPRTHFTNLLNGKYNSLGAAYGGAIGGRGDVDDLARSIVECGYNAFMGMSYGMDRVRWPGRNFIADLVRQRPELGPWEAYAPPSGRDQFLNAAVRHNLRFWENLFTQHDSIMPRGDVMLAACQRYTALEVQSMRHTPAFRGVCLYDELSQSLDHDSSMAIMAYFRRADEINYRRKYKGRTSSEALAARDRFFGRPPGQRRYEDAQIFRSWPRHLEEQWEDFSTRMSGAAKAVMPESRNYTYARMSALPGTILSGAPAARESVFRPLEIASAVGYKDMGGFGEFPTAGALGADALRTRDGLQVWPMLCGERTGAYSDSTLRQTFFTLSQKVEGIAFMQFQATAAAKFNDAFSGLRDITTLTTRYGDLLLTAKKGYKQVAIYYSREMERIGGGGGLVCEGLWTACIRAGFPADFLTDNQIRADKGLEYALIFVPNFTIKDAIPPETIAALKRLKAAGRKIVVERGSGLNIEGIERVDLDLYEIAGGETFPKHLDHDDERWWDRTENLTKNVRELLAKRVPPAAQHNLVVGPDWMRCRKGEYMILPNLARTGFRGNHITLYQAPDSPTLRFPERPPVCYDILETRRVETTTVDGWTTLTADMRHYPGKIYAFLPAAIESIVVRTAGAMRAGGTLSYEIFVADAQNKKIDAGIPLEITILSPSGNVLQQVYRAGAPSYQGAYVVPVNLSKGALKLRARELISGRVVEAAIALSPGAIQPAKLDQRSVRLTDAARIEHFMAEDVKVGKPRFTEKDLLSPGQFAYRLRKGKSVLEKYLLSQFSSDTRKLVAVQKSGQDASKELIHALVAELNDVISTGKPIYTDERFPPGKLSIAVGRLGQDSRKVTDKGKLADVNRTLLEEWYPDTFIPRPAVHIAVEEEWVRPQAERLRKALEDRGLRVRAEPMRAYVRGAGPIWQQSGKAGDLVLDGSRLWRGEIVQPAVFLDAPVILLGRRRGMAGRLVDRDALAEPVSENFPGPGKSIVTWVHKAFSNHFDTVAVLATDEAGLSAGVDALLDMAKVRGSNRPAHPIVTEPKFQTIASPKVFSDRRRAKLSFRDALRYEDRIETVQVDAKTGRVLVGTNGFGHNIFCFSADGKLLWKNFLPEHDVYLARWYDGGKRVLAGTGQGFFLFLIDGDTGKVFRKFASTEWPDFHVNEREIKTRIPVTLNPPMRQILVLGRTGIMAVDYDGKKMWFYDRAWDIVDYPAKAEQGAWASFGQYIRISTLAPSPDGTKVAYNEFRHFDTTRGFGGPMALWRNEPHILDARTGRIVLKNFSDPGSNDLWTITWPAGSAHPWIHAANLSAPLLSVNKPGDKGVDPGKLGRFVPPRRPSLKIGGRLRKTSYSASHVDRTGKAAWRTRGKNIWLVDLDRLSADDTRLYRCSRDGLLRCIDMRTGKTIWQHKLPCAARLWLTGDDNVLAGTRNGILVRFDAAGKVLWRKRLRDLHEVPGTDYAGYIVRAKRRDRDDTGMFYPVFDDKPDDYKGVVRMGLQQLDNGGFETGVGWVSHRGRLQLASPAHEGDKSLHLADGQLATCRVRRKVIPGATYLLEFFYRPDSFDTKLAAGAHLTGERDVFAVSNFSARPGEWTFGRVAIKARADTKAIDVGFEASGGQVWVDTVLLRAVRFPSANLLAYPRLHKVDVTHPTDHRIIYNRIPSSLRQNLLTRNNVTAFLQATPLGALIFTQEQAFLQNGVLDDVGPMWCYRPDPIGFSVILTKPAYVSHLVLYLNNSTPSMVYQNISILANDMKAKVPRTVGLVRGNKRRFIIVHFPKTLFTDSLKILPGKYRTQTDSITEIEVYGPVGGPEMLANKRFSHDPLATPMFMSTPSHVPATLPDDLVGRYRVAYRQGVYGRAPALHAGATVADGVLSYASATGTFTAVPVAGRPRGRRAAGPGQANWRIGTVTPLTTPARYARRLLAGSADYKMHAVADNGSHIWAFETGGRVYSSPVPDSNEVYFGSDDGRLYKLDVDSGILIWEFKTGGRVRSSPALDGKRMYAASWDSYCYAVDMVRGTQTWRTRVAPYTSGSPAVSAGRVYIGDDAGVLHCLDARTGKTIWRTPVGRRITTCPIVAPDGIFVVAERGTAALVDRDGNIIWKRNVLPKRVGSRMPPRLTGQPFATKTQVVLTSTHGVVVLTRADGTRDRRFTPPSPRGYYTSAVPYGKRLGLISNETAMEGRWRKYVVKHRGSGVIWAPE